MGANVICLKWYTLWSGLFKGLSFHCSTGRGCNKANKWLSQTGVPLVLAGGWRESETQDPGHRPAPCWALPGHGLNTERGFGTLARSYKDYLFKEGNKTGRHAKLRSMQQLSPLWKGYCWKPKSVFLCSWAVLWDRIWTTGKDKNRWKQRCWEQDMQIVSTLLGIVLLSWHKKNNDSFLQHFSEVAKSSKSSIIKL